MARSFSERCYRELYKLCRWGGLLLPARTTGGIRGARSGHRSGMDRRGTKERHGQQFRRSAYQRFVGAPAFRLADAHAAAGQVAFAYAGGAVGMMTGKGQV